MVSANMWSGLPPKAIFAEVNSDGACSYQQNIASAGVIIRDSNGQFIASFSTQLGEWSVVITQQNSGQSI